MSILIPQPSMALNSLHNPIGLPYKMWQTYDVADGTSSEHIIDWVAAVADGAPDHYLRVVIFNAHGTHAWVHMGEGFSRANVGGFARWKNKVANIWFIACKLADTAPPDPTADGNLFCSEVAKLSGAYVVASQDNQQPDYLFLGWGRVDDWEGRVFRWEPDHGSVDWHYHYGRNEYELPPPIAVPPHFRAGLGGARSFWGPPKRIDPMSVIRF